MITLLCDGEILCAGRVTQHTWGGGGGLGILPRGGDIQAEICDRSVRGQVEPQLEKNHI